MQRLFLFVCAACAACAGIIVLVMVAGGRLNPNWTPYFDQIGVCGAKLCAFGLVPGITSWDEVKAILSVSKIQNPMLAENGSVGLWGGEIDRTAFFLVGQAVNQSGQSTPAHLEAFVPSTPGLTAGIVVARYGAPCFIVFQNIFFNGLFVPDFTLFYPFASGKVSASATANGIGFSKDLDLNANDPVSLESYDLASAYNGMTTCAGVNSVDEPGKLPWRGFGSLGHLYSAYSP